MDSYLDSPKYKIKWELLALDREMPRGLEDLITEQMKTGYQPYQRQLDIIAKKQALRAELAALNTDNV